MERTVCYRCTLPRIYPVIETIFVLDFYVFCEFCVTYMQNEYYSSTINAGVINLFLPTSE
jgi:hypothetical protein